MTEQLKPVAYLQDRGEAACTLAEKLAGRTNSVGHEGNAFRNTADYFNRPLYEVPSTHRVVSVELLTTAMRIINGERVEPRATDEIRAIIDNKGE